MITSKVKSIRKGKNNVDLYDIIGIPNNHNFVAENMVIHNCDESVRFACTVADTKIKTNKGEFEIKDLVGKKDFKVLSYNKKRERYEYKKAGKCIKVKKDIVYEIETEDGMKIKATKEHKFLTKEGVYKELKDLKEGDEIYGTF